MAQHEISNSRKLIYYLGIVLIGLSFVVTFFTASSFHKAKQRHAVSLHEQMNERSLFGSLSKATGNRRQPQIRHKAPNLINIVIIGGLFVLGGVFLSVGRRGLAGSGLVLSATQESKDLEPWNRSKGRQLKQVITEAGLADIGKGHKETIIKVRCQNCDALNEEQDKFCGQCGKEI